MKRFLIFAAALLIGSFTAFGQITTGNPSHKAIKTGNRPQAGNFGLFIGAETELFAHNNPLAFLNIMNIKARPIVNVKYFITDQFETRLGASIYKARNSSTGIAKGATESQKAIEAESSTMFFPGAAYHFSKRNVLDVYAGAEIPLGRSGATARTDNENSVSRQSFDIGFGGFVGLQAFIGNLPVAIGLEYGLSTMWHLNTQYKHEVAGQIFYGPDTTADTHDKLSMNSGMVGQQIRLTLSYYFK